MDYTKETLQYAKKVQHLKDNLKRDKEEARHLLFDDPYVKLEQVEFSSRWQLMGHLESAENLTYEMLVCINANQVLHDIDRDNNPSKHTHK